MVCAHLCVAVVLPLACAHAGANEEAVKEEVDEGFMRFLQSVTWDGATDEMYKAVVALLAETGVKKVAHLDGFEMGFLRFEDAPKGTTLG